jgi:hypothetical protein
MPNYVQGSNDPLDSLTWEGMQSTSKVTRHRSEATPSRRIRRVHEDPRAHQSYQTALRQAMTHIHDIGAHLEVSRPRIGPFGHLFWSADHRSLRPGLYLPRVNSSFDDKVGSRRCGPNPKDEEAMAPPRQPWGKNQDIYQVLTSCLLLV